MTREEQIEEIANILWHIPGNYFLNSYNDCERIAECIYDDGGYRKQNEGEWIKSKSGLLENMSIDDKIEYWHTHETGNSLREFLGMTEQEYLEFCLPKQAIKDGESYLFEKGGDRE